MNGRASSASPTASAFKLLDYRKETDTYDRIVSVGMFEHVGRPHFAAFFRKLHALLKPEGVALVHTIGWQTPPAPDQSLAAPAYFPRRLSAGAVAAQRRFSSTRRFGSPTWRICACIMR